ncbi:MAG: silent information regulator protein Sir2 [Verrucomicrobia bacterium]|nr:silent information regulator protein Sir2 [Verrucomicrobiota bacterium]
MNVFRPLVSFVLAATAAASFAAEKFDRAMIALRTSDTSVYLGWRLLADDPAGRVFNVYRSTAGGATVKLNDAPMAAGTNFIDATARLDQPNAWWITTVALPRGQQPVEGAEVARVELPANAPVQPYFSIKLKDATTTFQKIAFADLNGDGKLDYIIKQPNAGLDPGTAAFSPDTYKLEAYLHDGTFLWRYDLGWNMNMGIWWTPFVVADFDGDGKAEVALKTAHHAGTREDSLAEKEGRARGFVISGPEWCSIFDGMTGHEIARADWVERGDPRDWGDDAGNRVNRNQIGLASLDGQGLSLLVCRGTYTRMVVDAYDFKNKKLTRLWRWDGDKESPQIRAQGSHTMKVGDVDGDGRDEIILGSVALRPDGKVLWNLGFGHPDIMYMTDVIPSRPGLEIAYGYEVPMGKNGLCLVDARTGQVIWGHPYKTTHIHDQGMFGDFIESVPGIEYYGAEQDGTGKWVYSAATGELITEENLGGLSPRAIWWGDTSTKAYIPGRSFGGAWGGGPGGGGGGRRGARGESSAGVPPAPRGPTEISAANPIAGAGGGRGGFGFTGPSEIRKYGAGKIGEFEGRLIAIADIMGDWREEIIVSLPGEIRIYTTTIPTARRRVCLLQDALYRKDVMLQTMGYFYPPQLSYHFR